MEEGFKSHGRQLRQSTLSHKPGRYEESQAYGVQIPSWVHPPLIFDHTLPRHCSFPSVPLDQPGRADAYVAARERGEIDEQNKEFSYDENDEKSCQASRADNNKKDCQIVAHNIAKRGPEQDETPKECPLDVTNDLDWGSPEPEETGEPVEWCQITLSGQWIILLALCQYKAFAPATQLLRMKVADIINFVGLYIHCHRETKKWAIEINRTPVDVLLQMANGVGASANETNTLKRPYLPTDVLWDSEREQAINYLHQVGQRGFVKDVKEWRGHSTAFHTLPIEPEIMVACTMILDKGMGSLDVEKIGFPQTERAKRSLISLGGVQLECHDLAKCMAELQSYLPPLATNTFEPMPASNLEALHDPWNHQNAEENGIGSSLKRSKELWNNTKHEAVVDHGEGPATTFNFNQYFAQDKLSVAKSSHNSLTVDYRKMDELYDPELLPQHRVPSIDLSGCPSFTQKKDKTTPVQEQSLIEEPQPLFHGLEALPGMEAPTIQIREASPQAESGCTTSCEVSASRLLPPVRSLHPPARLPGPNLGRDTYSFPEGLPVEVQSHNDMPNYAGANDLVLPTFTLDPNGINRGISPTTHPLNTSSITIPGGSTIVIPSFGNTITYGGPADSQNSTDVQGCGIPVTYQGCNKPDSQPNPSIALGVAEIAAVSHTAPNCLSQKTTDQTMASLPVVSSKETENYSAPDGTQQEENALTPPTQIDNHIESLATLSSRKSTRREISDSDEEYQPRPKRPRKSNPKKSTSQKKSISSHQPSQPNPGPNQRPATQLQTGTASTLQPVKRGRGRPRKYPRPQDLVSQPAQISAHNSNTQVPAATFSGTSNDSHPASAPDASTGKEAGRQTFTEGFTAAAVSTVASTSGRTLAHSSPQYCFHTFQPYSAPHATDPELNLLQTQDNVKRDVVTRPRPNSYKEFWENHRNLAEESRQGHRLGYSVSDNAASSFTSRGSETTLSAEGAFSPTAGQVRSDTRQTAQAVTQCASGIQKSLQD